MKKKWLFKAAVALSAAFVFSATATSSASAQKLSQTYNNPKKAKKGGTLRVGYIMDGVFKGVFAPELSVDGPTMDMMQFGLQDMYRSDKEHRFAKGGLADVTFDKKAKTATIKIKKNAGWSDGHPLEAEDYVYTYKLIANKATNSLTYDEEKKNIVGMEEYREGKSQEISGLEVKDPKTLVVHFKRMVPQMQFVGSSYLIRTVEPSHYLKDIPFDKLASSDQIQKHPLFYGPFQMTKLVKGESTEWVPNKYYGLKKPQVSKLVAEMVPTTHVIQDMKMNKYDIYLNQSSRVYLAAKKMKQYQTLGKKSLYYSYMGFKVGHADKSGHSVMDRDTPVRDKVLRQAMAYALNTDEVNKLLVKGLNYRGTTVVPDAYGKYHDPHIKGYDFNLKKANKLLDKAGYKKHKDGYRTLPNGKPFTLYLLASEDAGGKEIVDNFIQQWKKIGVKVKLKNGRIQEFNSYIEQLINDAKGYDLWFSNWSLGSEPVTSVTSMYLPDDKYNFSHFVTDENTKLIKSLRSDKAFDEKYLVKQFYKWQEYMNDEAYIVPRNYRYGTYTVSKKLKGVSFDHVKGYDMWSDVSFTK